MKLRVIPERLLFKQEPPSPPKGTASPKRRARRRSVSKAADDEDSWLPLDDSIGEITHIAFTYPKISSPSSRNAYNKAYMDLVFKMLNAKGLLEEGKHEVSPPFQISTIAPLGSIKTGGGEQSYQQMVEEVNHAISVLSGFNGISRHGSGVVSQGRQDNPSMWLQDDLLVLRHSDPDNRSVKIMENAFHQETYGAADTLAANLRRVMSKRYPKMSEECKAVTLDSIPLRNIVGGNVLFTDGYALVGYNNIKSEMKGCEDPDDFTFAYDLFKRKFNLPEERVIILRDDASERAPRPDSYQYIWEKNNERQPLNHLDLFITPAGRDVNGNPRLVIGKPVNPYEEDLACLNGISEGIEQFIRQIRAKMPHVVIIRNPLPLVYHDRFEDGRFIRKWFFASYNNVIAQFTGHGPDNKNIIWMPRYGKDYGAESSGVDSRSIQGVGGDWSDLARYDIACRRIYEGLGFKVIPLTNYLPFAESRSGPRCLTKVIERNPIIINHKSTIQA